MTKYHTHKEIQHISNLKGSEKLQCLSQYNFSQVKDVYKIYLNI